MFDIGFSEFIVIGLVALIVIGPERLPRVARTAGALLGRFQRYVNDVKSEVRREMEIEDLKRFQSQLTEQVRDVENTIHDSLRSVEASAQRTADEVEASVKSEPASGEAPAAAAGWVGEALPEQTPAAEAVEDPDTTGKAV